MRPTSGRPSSRRPTVGRGGVVVGPILPAKMPCNTHKIQESETAMAYRTKHHVLVLVYHGTERFPVNPLQRSTQGVEPNRPQHQIITCVFTLGPCGGYGHKLVARHACAHYWRDSAVNSVHHGREMGGFEPFDTFRCHRTSRSSKLDDGNKQDTNSRGSSVWSKRVAAYNRASPQPLKTW